MYSVWSKYFFNHQRSLPFSIRENENRMLSFLSFISSPFSSLLSTWLSWFLFFTLILEFVCSPLRHYHGIPESSSLGLISIIPLGNSRVSRLRTHSLESVCLSSNPDCHIHRIMTSSKYNFLWATLYKMVTKAVPSSQGCVSIHDLKYGMLRARSGTQHY